MKIKKTDILIVAKNLLAGETCDNCVWHRDQWSRDGNGEFCSHENSGERNLWVYSLDRKNENIMRAIPESRTCEHWEEDWEYEEY